MDYSLALRISSIFILFVASLVGILIPLVFSAGSGPRTNESHRKMCESDAFRITRTFAAGIMIGVGFIHLLADGVSTLAEVSPEYPALGYTLATVGAMIVLGFEQIAVMLIGSVDVGSNNLKSSGDAEGNIEADFGTGPGESKMLKMRDARNYHSCNHNHAIKMAAGADSLNVIVKAYMMEISVAIHSVIIGITIGSMAGPEELSALRSFILAICFHQFFEGIGLGTVIESARIEMGMSKIIIFALTFALTVPIGIMIGILITGDAALSTVAETTGTVIPVEVNVLQEYTLGCLNSIAAGNDEILLIVQMSFHYK